MHEDRWKNYTKTELRILYRALSDWIFLHSDSMDDCNRHSADGMDDQEYQDYRNRKAHDMWDEIADELEERGVLV